WLPADTSYKRTQAPKSRALSVRSSIASINEEAEKMTDVTVIAKPDLTGKRLAFALTEDRIGHYAEFRAYFVRTFDLDRVGLAEPGFVRAPSGLAFALVFIGRSGEPFPSG